MEDDSLSMYEFLFFFMQMMVTMYELILKEEFSLFPLIHIAFIL